ncbi:MAG: hypothetical protein JNK82_28995 [Myxococcaceae bacterium]|nr:hypothetical protein [Myxococcaceae bacterium]
MKPLRLSLAVAVALFASPAFAKASCLEKCSDSLVRCSNRCNIDAKCMNRCQNQLDECNNTCGKNGDTAMPMPKKCPDAKGRMIPCDAYSQPTGKTPKPPR